MYKIVVILLLSLTLSSLSLAQEGTKAPKSLYDIGVTAGAFEVPDYPGADQGRTRYLVLPYAIYRGKVIRTDDGGGIKGRFVSKDKWELDISAAAAFPANSKDNKTRKGMPDLDWIFEAGPRVVYHIFEDNKYGKLELNFPLRAVFSTDFGRLDSRGLLFPPLLDYKYSNFFHPKVNLYLRAGLLFGTKQLNNYFYEVTPKYETSLRPSYEAKGGYMGSRLGVAIRVAGGPGSYLFTGIGFDMYTGAVNESSPLMKRKTTETFVIGYAWTFYHSKEAEASAPFSLIK